MKKLLNYFFNAAVLIALPEIINAQSTPTAEAVPGVAPVLFEPLFYILSGLFFVMAVTIVVLTSVLMKLIKRDLPAPAEVEKIKCEVQNKESLWTRFDRKFLTKAVPVEREKDILFAHGYDGIHELDNDLPPWWKYGFYITIVWSVGYLFYYHVMDTGKLSLQEYETEMNNAEAAWQARMLKSVNMVTSETARLMTDAEALSSGKTIYTQNCVACHGQKGEGGVGPNLTDEFWIHGGGVKNVFKVIQNGVPAKGMISWKSQLSPKQIQEVSSYILSMQGSKPAGGKKPQGEEWKEVVVPADSSIVSGNETMPAISAVTK